MSLFSTSTNVPLTKNTPCPIDASDPIDVAFSDINDAIVSPAAVSYTHLTLPTTPYV